MSWEMALEIWLADRHRFYRSDFCVGFETDHAIDHQKWKAMRKNLHYLIDVETTLAWRESARYRQGTRPRILPSKSADQLRIHAVAGLRREDSTANARTEQREIAAELVDLMAHEFISKA